MYKYLFLFLTIDAIAAYQLETIYHKQNEQSEESFQSKDIVFEEEAVDLEQISQLKAVSIDDILRVTPSATTARGPRSSGESIQIRGLDSKKIFITIDGTRQNFRSGHSNSNPVNLDVLKKVDISKNSSGIETSGSLAGGANFVTLEPEDLLGSRAVNSSQFKYQFNSANNENQYNAMTSFKKNKLAGLFSLSHARAKELSLNDDTLLENSAYEDLSLFTKLKWKKFKVTYDYSKREDDNPLDPSLNPPERIKSLQADSFRIKRNLLVNYESQKLNTTLYLNNYSEEKKERESKILELREIQTLGGSILRSENNWFFGGEGFSDSLNSRKENTSINNFPRARSFNTSAFIQRKLSAGNVHFRPGLRLNHYQLTSSENNFRNKSASALSKNLAVNYKRKKLDLVASYSEGFNAPRLNEVYPSGLHARGDDFFIRDNYFIPNLNLSHETSQNYELGFKYHLIDKSVEKLNISASVYRNDIKNYIRLERIDRSVIDPIDGTTQFVNTDNVQIKGSEVKLSYLYDIYDLTMIHTQVRGRDKDQNLFLEDLPADQLSYNFRVFLDKYDLSFGYLGIQTKEQNRINPETLQRTDKTPAYFIHNVFIDQKVEDLTLSLRVDNIGNQKYRRHGSHLFESAQDIKFGITYKLTTL